jgi:hypothetical protein
VDLQSDALCGNDGACMEVGMKVDKKGKRNRHATAARRPAKPVDDPYEDDDIGDDNMLPLSIVRIWMDVVRSWRQCHRPACKRGRSCRGRYAQCVNERPPLKAPKNLEKDQRDGSRARAIMQRMLAERIEKDEETEAPQAAVPPRPAARRKRGA